MAHRLVGDSLSFLHPYYSTGFAFCQGVSHKFFEKIFRGLGSDPMGFEPIPHKGLPWVTFLSP